MNDNRLIFDRGIKPGPITLIFPGYMGSAEGFEGKYIKMSEILRSSHGGHVFRADNKPSGNGNGNDYQNQMITMVNGYIQSIVHKISRGEISSKEIQVIGFSAGASVVACAVSGYPFIKKVLLVSPSLDIPQEKILSGINSFKGKISICFGDRDPIVSRDFIEKISGNQNIFLRTISGCDHHFSEHQKILIEELPKWAFS